MHEATVELDQRRERERPLGEAWVRHDELWRVEDRLAESADQQDVEIERTRAPPDLGGAVAAVAVLDAVELLEQLVRREIAVERDRGVEEGRLGGATDRVGGVDARSLEVAAELGDLIDGGA